MAKYRWREPIEAVQILEIKELAVRWSESAPDWLHYELGRRIELRSDHLLVRTSASDAKRAFVGDYILLLPTGNLDVWAGMTVENWLVPEKDRSAPEQTAVLPLTEKEVRAISGTTFFCFPPATWTCGQG